MCETIQTYFMIPKGSLPFDTSLSDLVSKVYIFKAISAKVSWFPVVCLAHWNILLIFQWRKPGPSETLIEVDEIIYLVAAMEFPPGRIILWINQLLSFHGISDFSIHIFGTSRPTFKWHVYWFLSQIHTSYSISNKYHHKTFIFNTHKFSADIW